MIDSPEALLESLIRLKTLSGEEGASADLVQQTLAEWGFEVRREGNNVWAEAGSSGPRLLMVSHLDTVPPCDGWETDPWTPTWKGDALHGLGANDAGGCGVAMLFAFRALAQNPEGRIMVALTAEEENGGANGIQSVVGSWGVFDGAFVGEPTQLRVCTAQRGMLLIRCEAHGTSAHVAHAHRAENAIHKAARDIARLEAMRFEPHPVLGETRAQVVHIEGGLARNQVPDRCAFFVDFRTTPNLDHDELSAQICRELESATIIHSERYHPCGIDPEHPFAKACRSAAENPEPIGSATVSDWAFLGEIPAVKVGPGDTHRSHTANEYLLRSELHAGIAFYEKAARAAWRMHG